MVAQRAAHPRRRRRPGRRRRTSPTPRCPGPTCAGSPYAGECWAIEAELTPKPLARTTAIMTGLLTRTAGYQPGSPPRPGPRYHRVVYLTAPAAAQRGQPAPPPRCPARWPPG